MPNTPTKLSDAQIRAGLIDLTDWQQDDDALCRHLQFEDFVAAFGFMTQVAILAQEMNHHPNWSNVYNRVTIKLSTHDAGGISMLDFQLAKKIDALLC
jgi:4a-hydroxytetrahydrobiopterin dehydratase